MANASLFSAAAKRLEGKVALITGGSSGIGACTAKLFSKHGAKVLIADIQQELGQSVCKDIGSASSSFVHCDVTNEKDVENAVNTAVSKYGKLDIMFNNAGIVGAPKSPNILDCDKDEYERVLRVDLVGPFLGTKHAARVMIPARRGSIITTASVAGSMGGVAPHAYTSSKHGVVGLTKNTAVELGQFGIRVNCISPYAVSTQMARDFLKLRGMEWHDLYANLKGVDLEPKDVAEAALYLGSDESSYVSGHNLIVDGSIVHACFQSLHNLVDNQSPSQ